MAKQVLLNARYFMGAADLTGQNSKLELNDAMEEKETTTFNSGGAKEVLAGVESVAINAEGFIDSAETLVADKAFWDARRVIEAHSACPETAAVGALAYVTQAVRLGAKLFGSVGDVLPWTANSTGSYPLARGVVLSAPGTAITSDTNGTAVQLGAVASTQRLYAALHVISVAGTNTPTIGVTIESDSANNFPSTTTQLTFTTRSTVGSEVQRTAIGAITDTWYRAVFDVTANGGTGMSFLALVTVGIA